MHCVTDIKWKKAIIWRISFLVNSPLNQRPTSATLNKAAFTVQKKWCSVQQNHPEDLSHYTQHDVRLSDASLSSPQTSFVYTYKHKSTVLAFLTFALCSLTALLPIQSTVSHFSAGQEVCRHTTKRRLLSVSLQVVTILLHSDWKSQQGAASAFNKKSPLSIWTVLKLS